MGKAEHENFNLIKCAIVEVICWWDTGVANYHDTFKKLDRTNFGSPLYRYVRDHHFRSFIRSYSVARTIPNGNAHKILDLLVNDGFITAVKRNEISAVGKYSKEIKDLELAKGSTISLLSKLATMINPKVFTMYDKQGRDGLYSTLKLFGSHKTHKQLKDYKEFYDSIELLHNEWEKGGQWRHVSSTLLPYKRIIKSNAVKLYFEDPIVIKRRILDKYLWLKGNKGDYDVEASTSYLESLKIG